MGQLQFSRVTRVPPGGGGACDCGLPFCGLGPQVSAWSGRPLWLEEELSVFSCQITVGGSQLAGAGFGRNQINSRGDTEALREARSNLRQTLRPCVSAREHNSFSFEDRHRFLCGL